MEEFMIPELPEHLLDDNNGTGLKVLREIAATGSPAEEIAQIAESALECGVCAVEEMHKYK